MCPMSMSVVGVSSDPTKGKKVCAINIVFDAIAVIINSIVRYLSCRRNVVIQVLFPARLEPRGVYKDW